jgi:hypothetical protein
MKVAAQLDDFWLHALRSRIDFVWPELRVRSAGKQQRAANQERVANREHAMTPKWVRPDQHSV